MKQINLLPKEKQREFAYRKVFRSLMFLFGIAGLTFALVAMFQFGSRLYMEREIKRLGQETERIKAVSDKDENAQLKSQIQHINNQMSDFNQLSNDAPKWSGVIRAFSRLVPDGVFVQTFAVDVTKKQVSISGFAPRRESVILLYNNIAADTQNFANIDYPLENVSRPTDVQFRFTFTVLEGVLK